MLNLISIIGLLAGLLPVVIAFAILPFSLTLLLAIIGALAVGANLGMLIGRIGR